MLKYHTNRTSSGGEVKVVAKIESTATEFLLKFVFADTSTSKMLQLLNWMPRIRVEYAKLKQKLAA